MPQGRTPIVGRKTRRLSRAKLPRCARSLVQSHHEMRRPTGRRTTVLLVILASCAKPPCHVFVRHTMNVDLSRRPPSWVLRENPDLARLCEVAPDAWQCGAALAYFARPRCAAGSPDCGPDKPGGFNRCYREDGPRQRLDTSTTRYSADSGGICHYDGECRLARCDTACVSYRRPPRDYACLQYQWGGLDPPAEPPERTDLLCGCVEDQCVFFSQ